MNQLPIDSQIPEILAILRKSDSLVLSAAPGAGKTTRLPPALIELTDKQVWVLEPRRVAAVAAANRIASEKKWQLGGEVGYQVRFDNKTNKSSKLIFLTEALLARKLVQNPDLSEVGIVVLDEFHERSIHVDLALGLLKELQLLSRPDLKIVVMSATLDTDALAAYLDDAPKVKVPGQLFDLELTKISASQLLRTDYRFIERVTDQITSHIRNFPQSRDTLVFLPGQSEIRRCQEKLSEWAAQNNILIVPLTGSLGLSEQMLALAPQKQRKVILATNVAESSLTIDGVDTVIDSGLARMVKRHPKTEFEQLVTARISKASAKQRAGRAARQFKGLCYQLWNSQDELSMPEFEIAEIHRIDLAESVLFLKSLGVSDVDSFSWFEKPSPKTLTSAEQLLNKISATQDGKITEHGRRLAEIPLSPRIAQVMVVAEELNAPETGCDLCALLSEKDLSVGQNSHCDDDFQERLDLLYTFRKQRANSSRALQQVLRAAYQLGKFVKKSPTRNDEPQQQLISNILLRSFPDRICRRRKANERQALMTGGRGVELAETSLVKKSEFFVAVDLIEINNSADTQVRRASAVTKEQIEKEYRQFIEKTESLVYDESTGRFYIEEIQKLWDLPISNPVRRAALPEETKKHFSEIFVQRFAQVCKENEILDRWLQRWNFFAQKEGLDPFWNQENLKNVFDQACLGESQWQKVIDKNLIYFFETQIDHATLQRFQKLCPDRIQVPTGNQLRLVYHQNKNPHLEVRLQEMFGMKKTPTIWQGEVPVTLHLLGPNYRPVQMTSDLEGFWQNTYQEVRKELRARYPKHSWPEDPLSAPPVAKGRPRK